MIDIVLFVFIIISLISLYECFLPSSQINGLKYLYKSLNGDNWSECKWNITQLAINNTLPTYYCGLYIVNTTNNTQTIYNIDFFYDNNLNGTISEKIDMLYDIQLIEIMYNELLYGTIPTTICNLKYLKAIHFENANFNGSVPKCIGNISSIRWIGFMEIPLLSMTDEIIKLWCLNAKNVFHLLLGQINYTGSIPECIGYEFPQLQSITFFNLPYLNSTIPPTFNNLTQLIELELIVLPHLYGTFPSDIFKKNNLYNLQIAYTSLSGNISINNLCKSTHLQSLIIQNNEFLSPFSIPHCIDSLTNLQTLSIGGSLSIYGSIPDSLCSLNKLVLLSIYETSVTGSIPKCITQDLTKLIYINFQSNYLNGDFPAISSPKMKLFDIHNNEFSGSISSIFALNQYPHLEAVILHSNNFYDSSIDLFIKKLFSYSPNLKGITIYDQKYIGGEFPEFGAQEIYLNDLSVFAAHKLNIGGSLPNNVHFAANVSQSIVSIYSNQLSSSLPTNLYMTDNVQKNITPIVLTGNLFTIYSDNDIPKWMDNSQFVSASQLFVTLWNVITNWIVLIIAIICYILIMIKQKYGLIPYSDIKFICSMKQIDKHLNDKKLLFLILILCIFYPFSSEYYESTTISSKFSMYFFQTKNIYIISILCLLIIIYNLIMINIILKIGQNTLNHKKDILSEFDVSDNNDNRTDLGSIQQLLTEKNDENASKNVFLYNLFIFSFYFILYVLSISLLILYILSKSLPTNNALNINEYEQGLLSNSIQIILAINSSLIIPRFIQSILDLFYCIKKSNLNKSYFIMITRTMTTIIIPFIFSVLLLNDCGNGWTKLWKPCIENADSFNIIYPLRIGDGYYNYSYGPNQTAVYRVEGRTIQLQVLRESDVCSVTSFSGISWNKCIRIFLYDWCNVLMIKMIFMFFMPIFIILFKTIKTKIYYKTNIKKNAITAIKIDSEYSMITTNLEIVISFGIFCPLLFPIVIVSINSFIYFYIYTINKLKWKVEFLNYSNDVKSFPFNFLWFSVFIEQFLSFLFFKTDQFNYNINTMFSWILLASYIIMDLSAVYRVFKNK